MIPIPIKLYLNNFILTVKFENGQIREIDVRNFLGDSPKSKEVKTSISMFNTAYIEDDIAITWENGFSLDPDVVYEDGKVLQNLPSTATLISALKKVIKESTTPT